MKHRKNQLAMLITQYYCKTLSNCILGHRSPYFRSLDRGYTDYQAKWCPWTQMRPDLCNLLVRSQLRCDVTTFASLVHIIDSINNPQVNNLYTRLYNGARFEHDCYSHGTCQFAANHNRSTGAIPSNAFCRPTQFPLVCLLLSVYTS